MEIRRSYDCLISTLGFPILVRWHLYIESGPRASFQYKDHHSVYRDSHYKDKTIVLYHFYNRNPTSHDDVIKWKHFPRYWPFVWRIHRSPVNSPHKGQWRRALMFSLICALNKRLCKQWSGWWFETQSCPLWHHCNEEKLHLILPRLQGIQYTEFILFISY